MKRRLSLSLITQFQAFQAAAAECATVILLQHSLIKAFIDINKHGRPDWGDKWPHICVHPIGIGDFQISASCQWQILQLGRPAVVRGNLALR